MWASIIRRSWLGARCLSRSLGPWPLLLVLAWALMTRLQEPAFLHRRHVPFYWDSLRALVLLLLSVLPLVWRWTQDPRAEIPRSENAAAEVFAGFLAVAGYGIWLLAASLALSFTVERIFGEARDASGALRLAGSASALLVATASSAPALAALRWSTSGIVSAWLVFTGAAFVLVGPASPLGRSDAPEIWPPGLATAWFPGMLSVTATVLGGLALSLAQHLRQTHADRNPRRHP